MKCFVHLEEQTGIISFGDNLSRDACLARAVEDRRAYREVELDAPFKQTLPRDKLIGSYHGRSRPGSDNPAGSSSLVRLPNVFSVLTMLIFAQLLDPGTHFSGHGMSIPLHSTQ